jgi:hypothetical protein
MDYWIGIWEADYPTLFFFLLFYLDFLTNFRDRTVWMNGMGWDGLDWEWDGAWCCKYRIATAYRLLNYSFETSI